MQRKKNQNALDAILTNVTDRSPVDWAEAGRSFPDLAPLLEQLAAVDSIAAMHESGGSCAAPSATSDAATPPMPAAWGPLLLREKLGEGGFGEVFRAFDPVLQREVALKLGRAGLRGAGPGASDQAEALHLEEARRLARIRHPNVLAVHGIEVHDGRVGLWTDLLPGETLEQVLAKSGPLPADDLARIGVRVCRALTAIHGAEVLHGDIKAGNIMREPNGNVVLMDFGAGRRLAGPAPDAERDEERLFGTPVVLPPEVLKGQRPTVAADLYSLGVLLYRLATGRYPAIGSSIADQLARLRRREVIPLDEQRPDLPPVLSRAIMRALAYEPGERFETAAQFETFLAAALGDGESDLSEEADPAPAAVAGLPAPPTRFVGRREELRRIREILEPGSWVTLIGAGGSGKTRLALEAASTLGARYPDGVRWVDLSGVAGPSTFLQEMARSLSLRAQLGATEEEALLDHLRGRSVLLLIDNAEHLRDACRAWAESVMAACSRLAILATSREAMGGRGEVLVEVGSLDVPREPSEVDADPARVVQFASVRLFVDRAYRSHPDFRLTRENAPSVAAICRRLDGLPLAIELAASRVRALAPMEIAHRLDQSLRVLADRDAAIPRHTTIEAMLDWSYGLLSEAERALLMRLSVFRGGWTAVAAEHVCADQVDESPVPDLPRDLRGVPARSLASPGGSSIHGEEIVDVMAVLVRRSLVQFDSPAAGEGIGRYRPLEVVRQFGREKLRASGMEDVLVGRHVHYHLLFAVEAERRLLGPDAADWHARLTREHDNLHAALAESTGDRTRPEIGMRLAFCLGRYWAHAGLFSMGIAQITQQLDRQECQSPSWYRAALLTWAGIMSFETGRNLDALRFHEASRAIMTERGDRHGIATSLAGLGDVVFRMGEYDRAREYFEENLATMRAIGDPMRLGMGLNKLAVFYLDIGDPVRARVLQEEHLAVQRSCESIEGIATALSNLSIVLVRLEETSLALEHATEALALRRRIGDKSYMTTTLNQIARIHVIEGRLDRALPFLREVLNFHLDSQRPASVVQTLEILSEHAESLDRLEETLVLLSASSAVRESAGVALHAPDRRRLEARIEHLRSLAGESAAERSWVAGQAMTIADALLHALAYVEWASSAMGKDV